MNCIAEVARGFKFGAVKLDQVWNSVRLNSAKGGEKSPDQTPGLLKHQRAIKAEAPWLRNTAHNEGRFAKVASSKLAGPVKIAPSKFGRSWTVDEENRKHRRETGAIEGDIAISQIGWISYAP